MKPNTTWMVVMMLWGAAFASASERDAFWPEWRGPRGTGVAPSADPPTTWSETEHVKWKVAIPGKGLATPIVWDDRMFLLTAVATDEKVDIDASDASDRQGWMNPVTPDAVTQFQVLALRREDGSVLWQRTARSAVPHDKTHGDASWASNSPVTDGERVFAYFGSEGLYCYDWQGRRIWERDFGDMQTRNSFGEGSSPTLFGDTLVVNWDHEGASFIVALDKHSGEERWRVARDEPTSWSTPLVVQHQGVAQVIVSASNAVRGYALDSGRELWSCGGMTLNVVPSPVFGHGRVYVASGFRGNALLAIDLDKARGEITDTDAVAWTISRHTPYVPSLLLAGDWLYMLKTNHGKLSCVNAKTGSVAYGPEQLDEMSGAYASPVAAADRVYVLGRKGRCVVLRQGETFDVLAVNLLDDRFDASPAIAGDELFLRGHQFLYCIAE